MKLRVNELRFNGIPTDCIQLVAEDEPDLVSRLIGVETIDHPFLGEEDEVTPLGDRQVVRLRVNPLASGEMINDFLGGGGHLGSLSCECFVCCFLVLVSLSLSLSLFV